ncbi:ATP-dependent acyl-CoA ligase [Xylanimonas allomyrinae]|uniref:ATP-dependent acyl-CoA ligase n=1 Tax=Xylanimonas allomyrinae TaxID=2509459 RepID=A0A4P6EJP6_9MICO|nr:AMP-binding protein [Xylanimonas allomyrinae]QAY62585.1 ATP-dependent acyl-CoA ligase [Xylanimonas allomyrinae]
MTHLRVREHPWRDWAPGRRTVSQMLTHAAETEPRRLVLTVGERRYTAQDLVGTAAGVAAALRALGAGRGSRVAMLSPNRAESLEVLFGAAWNGSVLVPLNPALRGDSLRHQLLRTRPSVVVFDRSTAAQLRAVSDVLDEIGDPPRVIVGSDALDAVDHDLAPEVEEWLASSVPYAPAPAGAGPVEVSPSDPAAVLFTSGTTGPPKGVVIPHGQLWWWAVISGEELELGSDDVLYTCLPLFHTNALTTPLQALASGARAVIGPKFSVSRFWGRVAQAGATVTYVLGAMSTMLWNRRPAQFEPAQRGRLRRILGPGIDPALKPRFEAFFGVAVVEGFGMTEIGVPLYTPVGLPMCGAVGVPHPDYEVALLDADGTVLEGVATGELAVRPMQPSMISTGYLDDPAATSASRTDLWFHTGDLVARDADGVYRWRDRIKDSIRRRGENISSHDVEQAVRRHPAVADAAAVAVPSELGEDEVLVVVQLADGHAFEPEELIATAAENLPAFALPRFLRVVDELPLTANGKVSKAMLRAAGVTAEVWSR